MYLHNLEMKIMIIMEVVLKMKKINSVKMWLAIFFAFCMMMMPKNQIKAEAADIIATVEGIVSGSTTSDLLYLSTNDGMMQIKLDSTTEVSGITVLMPNTKVYVSITYGNDGYLHAAKLFKELPKTAVVLDSGNAVTISGTISTKSAGDLLYVNTSNGEMQIKFDENTKLNIAVLMLNKTYNFTCVRGSDAYMHAVSIDDPTAGTALATSAVATSTYTTSPASAVTAPTTAFSGTVGSNTKENLLYLMTSGGEMQIVIDANTDSRLGMVLTPGSQLLVSAYHGSDAYMHAAVIMGAKFASTAVQIDSSSPLTVTGTVGSKSNENMLYLNTSQGEMQMKLDGVNSVSGCKVLVSGKQITVTCGRGSDAYLHVLTIKGY